MRRPIRLISAEVHLWRIALAATGDASVLARDERERAGRFRFARDRRRFVAARAGLRRILSRYLGVPPEHVQFAYGRHGKPGIAGGGNLYFNLSHAEELGVVAVTRIGEVGVDIEFLRPIEMAIAERYFAPAEVAALGAVREDDRRAAFFRCWTRKEAYLKARGEGVLLPLDKFEVSVGSEPALLQVADDPGEARRWQIAALTLAPGYVGAVALRATGWRLRKKGTA